ncbi:MAG: hypothetical protein PHT37_02000 [Candidatus Cloacimonetes bacterium]|nr:hypothetical protein [Candidatus Cloacimonadota bacterium]MDD2422836.1 hypothetical protein [Candidatus Cloacimonadota bacterium]MDD4276648.1 hypothetical protein [Candidatus Cloacimonadota bacterium]MDY0325094.1 hypothetical protein [Candidatus Cloacimonadaceae bacterium]
MKKVLLIALLAILLLGTLSMTACKPKPEVIETEEIIPEDNAVEATEEATEATEEEAAADAVKEVTK